MKTRRPATAKASQGEQQSDGERWAHVNLPKPVRSLPLSEPTHKADPRTSADAAA